MDGSDPLFTISIPTDWPTYWAWMKQHWVISYLIIHVAWALLCHFASAMDIRDWNRHVRNESKEELVIHPGHVFLMLLGRLAYAFPLFALGNLLYFIVCVVGNLVVPSVGNNTDVAKGSTAKNSYMGTLFSSVVF